MEIERRALYNLMRMSWLADSTIAAEPWQVEDYRALSLDLIFSRLKAHDIALTRNGLVAFAAEVDTPEELTDLVLHDDADVVEQDQVYLLLFEVWRRLITDRPSLSIFCDELDHMIYKYDNDATMDEEGMHDIIANLQDVLNQNFDQGAPPQEVFEMITGNCANDIENFLYDYILVQLHEKNEGYASELIEGFSPYVSEQKWFSLLRAEQVATHDMPEALSEIKKLVQQYSDKGDLEFNLELLSFMIKGGPHDLFVQVLQKTLPLLQVEEEYRELLMCCKDFFHERGKEAAEMVLEKIATKRSHYFADSTINSKDQTFEELLTLFKNK